jgi:hypothetical protein
VERDVIHFRMDNQLRLRRLMCGKALPYRITI